MGLGRLFKKLTGTERIHVPQKSSQWAGEEKSLLDQLKSASEGKTPSVAQMAGKEASERGLSQTSSAIRSAPGLGSALKGRLIARAGEAQQSDIARQTGQLRAGEMATARGQRTVGLGQALSREQGERAAKMKSDEATQARRGKLFGDIMTAGTSLVMPKKKKV